VAAHVTVTQRPTNLGEMMGFLNLFRYLKSKDRRYVMLERARSSLLDAVGNKEYYDAVVPMLRKRVHRLEQEITKQRKVIV
jgi:hypothetical protein